MGCSSVMRKGKEVMKRLWAEGEKKIFYRALYGVVSCRCCGFAVAKKNGWQLAERRKEKVPRCRVMWVYKWVFQCAIWGALLC